MHVRRRSIDRRTLLKGTGVSLALPWLEGMGSAIAQSGTSKELPRRMACIMFPYGVALPKDDDPPRPPGAGPKKDGAGEGAPDPAAAEALARDAWIAARTDLVGGRYAEALQGYTTLLQQHGNTALFRDNKAKITAMIQNRITTFDSLQPESSK